jgi:hypothetical protein
MASLLPVALSSLTAETILSTSIRHATCNGTFGVKAADVHKAYKMLKECDGMLVTEVGGSLLRPAMPLEVESQAQLDRHEAANGQLEGVTGEQRPQLDGAQPDDNPAKRAPPKLWCHYRCYQAIEYAQKRAAKPGLEALPPGSPAPPQPGASPACPTTRLSAAKVLQQAAEESVQAVEASNQELAAKLAAKEEELAEVKVFGWRADERARRHKVRVAAREQEIATLQEVMFGKDQSISELRQEVKKGKQRITELECELATAVAEA